MSKTSFDTVSRRFALRLRLALVGAVVFTQPLRALAGSDRNQITLWKNASCGSCHTASLGNYVVEGRVPAQALRRLLREQP